MLIHIIVGQNKKTKHIAVFDVYDNTYAAQIRITQRRKNNDDYIYWLEHHEVKSNNLYDSEII